MCSDPRRVRRRLQPLSAQEALNGAALGGLSEVVSGMVEGFSNIAAPLSSQRPNVIAIVPRDEKAHGHASPGALVSPGDINSPDVIGTPVAATSPEVDASTKAVSTVNAVHRAKEKVRRPRSVDELVSLPPEGLRLEEAQQALTPSEFIVYSRLRIGSAKMKADEDGDDRLWMASMKALAVQTGLSERTCQRSIQGLQLKGAVEIDAPANCAAAEPPRYRAKSFAAIMRHLKAQGITHVRRGRSPVLLRVGDDMNAPGDTDTPGALMSPGETMTGEPGVIVTGESGVTNAPLSIKGIKTRNKDRKQIATAASAVDANAVAAAMSEFHLGDMNAARRIIESALMRCPECITDDVVSAVRRKLAQLQRQRTIENPVGLLIASCADVVLAVYTARKAAEASCTARDKQKTRLSSEATFLRLLDGLPSDNPWRQILDHIRPLLPVQYFETWLKPTRFWALSDQVLTVCIPCDEFKHIGEKYVGLITEATHELDLSICTINYRTSRELVDAMESQPDEK